LFEKDVIMALLLREDSTITAKGQTTVPKAVRQALGVAPGDRVSFVVVDERRVYLEKVGDAEQEDPVVESFLSFLSRDMVAHPDTSVIVFPPALRDRITALTEGADVDPDAEIEGDVAL
jgi:antitoxin PrlF